MNNKNTFAAGSAGCCGFLLQYSRFYIQISIDIWIRYFLLAAAGSRVLNAIIYIIMFYHLRTFFYCPQRLTVCMSIIDICHWNLGKTRFISKLRTCPNKRANIKTTTTSKFRKFHKVNKLTLKTFFVCYIVLLLHIIENHNQKKSIYTSL